ncbi:MAG: carboxylesterase family protein, partial [Actinomycetia bacterium]|nr:carboxylesterase family protein [Actinomycetes bacterium]
MLLLAACGSNPLSENAADDRGCDEAVQTVDLGIGSICGVVHSNQQGQQSHAYLGIPYARPPVEDLRWKAPEPLSSLEGSPFAAAKFGSECVQPSSELSGYSGSEDCLYLNV